jgi:putative transposase
LPDLGSTGAVHAIKWAVQRGRYMTLETLAGLSDDPIVKLPAVAA